MVTRAGVGAAAAAAAAGTPEWWEHRWSGWSLELGFGLPVFNSPTECTNPLPDFSSLPDPGPGLSYPSVNGEGWKLAMFTVMFVLLRYIIVEKLIRSWAERTQPFSSFRGYKSLPDDKEAKARLHAKWHRHLDKVCDTGYRALYYTTAFAFGISIFHKEKFFYFVEEMWIGWPQPIPDSFNLYFQLQTTHTVALLIYLVFLERRTKDFWMLFVHHCVTITLCSLAYFACHWRGGGMILLVLDTSDVFLECAKWIMYNNMEALSTFMFALLLISWLATRLIIYPFRLQWSTSTAAHQLCDYGCFPVAEFGNWILMVLIGFWTVMLVRMTIRTLTEGKEKGLREDVREKEGHTTDTD